MPHILLLGATGYIGGSVLDRLLKIQKPDITISVIVRDSDKAKKLATTFPGLDVHNKPYEDHQLLVDLASRADVVFNCVNADDHKTALAILDGLKRRHEKTGKAPALIHTSGTGTLVDNARGMYTSETIYSDLDIPKFEALPPTQPHRNVDIDIINADLQGYVKTYLVLPTTIYGLASGRLVDLGIQNKHSLQIPQLVKISIDRRRAGYVGLGKNIWANVHIDDVADMYIILFNAIHDPAQSPAHGRFGIYFAENGEHELGAVAQAIADAFAAIKPAQFEPLSANSFTEEEMQKYFSDGNGESLGTNSRCRAERARAIGWAPVKKTSDLLASVKEEVAALINRQKH